MPIPRFNELSAGVITAIVRDANGDPLAGSDLATLTLTITDLDSNTILNERQADNILAGSPLPVDEDGVLTLELVAEDNAIVETRKQIERHKVLLEFSWADGSSFEEIEIEVVNLRRVGPASPN